jgi:dihydroorotate dehydrogenase
MNARMYDPQNRYGFNSGGADEASRHLHQFRATEHHHRRGLVGVNAGKNKLTSDEDAKNDYAAIIKKYGFESDRFSKCRFLLG